MSRRKQSNPRQIKRAFGEMEEEEAEDDALPREDESQSENEGGPSDHDGSVGDASPKTSSSGRSETKENSASPKEPEKEDVAEAAQELKPWNGPGELEVVAIAGETQLRSRQGVPQGLSWGPYRGDIHSRAASPGHTEPANPPVTLVLEEEPPCWLSRLPLVPGESEANLVIYKKDNGIWCKTTKATSDGEALRAFVMAEPLGIPNHTVKTEAGEPSFPSALSPEIQLLPQQAGMAAILATAVVNKDVFPCKDCGIWYRSERNLRAHLTFYCASRQSAASPAVEEKQPKETYPNERICPFPQCKKSCPSASSLEIHMRSHSGERPFVCLICLSAFTTKANCERHLKVHTDTLSGVCHSCGFISTTRDILYSHLVTNHMICQPGSKGEVYSPGTAVPPPPLNPGLSATAVPAPTLKCSFCGYVADGLPSLQQHVVLHSVAAATAAGSEPRAAQSLPEALVKPGTTAEEDEASFSPLQEGRSPAALAERVPPVQIKEEPLEEEEEEEEEEDDDEGVAHESKPFRTRAGTVSEPEPEAASRASSTHSLPPVKVKSEVGSPTGAGSSPPGPTDPGHSSGPPAAVFLPQYVFGHEAAAVVPQASEILAKMSELVHSRLKQGHGGAGPPPSLFPGSPLPKGATCFECEITFNNINNYYVHKRLYCSSRRGADESPPGTRRAKAGAPPGPAAPKGPPAPGTLLSPQLPGEGKAGPPEGEAGPRSTPPGPEVKQEVKVEEGRSKASPSPEVDRAGRLSEDSQSPGASSVEEPEEDPSQTACEACNIRFSRHETYMVHKRYYCASRHDPPLRRAGAASKVPFFPQPFRTRKRRKLYEIHAASGGTPDIPRPEAPALVPALISVVKPAPSPGSSPDVDGPIDLSKKPRLLHGGEGLPSPLLPLADYHECTACCVSFHSLDGYLAHKKYYCPATPMQAGTLEQLQKIKGAVPALLKAQGSPEAPGEERAEKTPTKAEKAAPSMNPAALQPSLDHLHQRPLEAKASHRQGSKAPLAVCPYCPLNGAVKGDLAEHFRNAHGLFVAKTLAGVASVEATRTLAEGGPLPSLPLASPPQPPPPPRLRKDSFNGDGGQPPVPLVPNGSPQPSVSPQPLLPASPPIPLPISPGPEASPNAFPGHTDKSVQTPPGKGPPPALNGNHRFCRLCNIKFSSLSTFIAHKKYYCSSHAAEHVK